MNQELLRMPCPVSRRREADIAADAAVLSATNRPIDSEIPHCARADSAMATGTPGCDYAAILPPRRVDVRVYDFGDEAVLHDAARGDMTLLNKTAAAVWRRCDGSATIPAIADELVRNYDVDPAVAQDHLEQLLSRFAGAGLLAENA